MILSLLTTALALPALLLLHPELLSASFFVQHFSLCSRKQFLNLLTAFLSSHCISPKKNGNNPQILAKAESGNLSAAFFWISIGLRSDSTVTLFHNPCEYELAGNFLGHLVQPTTVSSV